MDLQLRHLRAFSAVADAGSFTAASARLRITQPALSRTVQQLESSLGVQLFERTSRTVELTAAGRDFLLRVRAVLHDLDHAVADVRRERILRVGFSWVLPDPWAAEKVASFEAATGAQADLLRRDDIDAALLSGEVDVALIRHETVPDGVAVRTLLNEPRVAAVSSRSPLAALDRIDWLELGTHPVVVNTLNGNTRPGLWPPGKRPPRTVECRNYDEWIALIAAGRGVGATAASAAGSYLHTGIVYIALTGAPPVPLKLAWLPRRRSPLMRSFMEAVTGPAPAGSSRRAAPEAE
ncbi:LysR family transcriptional regulator [Sediminivirga luteola]|uniref:LysR family transcriptional regulator n=1 Tax=Sediminivirga luteola TaxID=1774748 RepID=A0A8J2TYQ9_9MICO|nr:LysR family transcriptional regulator [Sediminivirga luteola]MCI2264242.1 LysR family transcriptional regulator [Sediminivirga luteola]GGA17078.1 LysR family transcriptional regulator [Sediminivirga luteola]